MQQSSSDPAAHQRVKRSVVVLVLCLAIGLMAGFLLVIGPTQAQPRLTRVPVGTLPGQVLPVTLAPQRPSDEGLVRVLIRLQGESLREVLADILRQPELMPLQALRQLSSRVQTLEALHRRVGAQISELSPEVRLLTQRYTPDNTLLVLMPAALVEQVRALPDVADVQVIAGTGPPVRPVMPTPGFPFQTPVVR